MSAELYGIQQSGGGVTNWSDLTVVLWSREGKHWNILPALITSVKILYPPRMLGCRTRRWSETDQDAFLFIPLSSVSEHIGTHRDAVNRWGTTCFYPVCFSWLARRPSARILNSWGLHFPYSCPGTLECTFWYCVRVMWNKSLKGLAWCLLIGV